MKNVILIGMPGAGKSTVGVVLAKRLGYTFLDSDLVIQQKYGKLLHELIREHGVEGFWKIENDVNAGLTCDRTVIATGGSAIYGAEAMEHLRSIGTVVYLRLTLPQIEMPRPKSTLLKITAEGFSYCSVCSSGTPDFPFNTGYQFPYSLTVAVNNNVGILFIQRSALLVEGF